ncbi:MAG: pyridoxal-phosphate dependent enzyme [Xanthomonadaceae bacterium]|nr:pyridoxal-phosphate dependent enzyme [Xanthomonadaceae bacterium]
MSANDAVLELIGDTPIVKVRSLDTGPCELYLKLENLNPSGSIKDRIGSRMIEAAERRGDIRPGVSVLVEGSAGNTGAALALAALRKGYRLRLAVPDRTSREQVFYLKALGAEVTSTRSDVGIDHPEHYRNVAARLAAETENGHFVDQFANPDNAAAHAEWTGPEILRQMREFGGLDAVVLGCGSGGTLTGLSQCFAGQASQVELVLADPAGSVLAHYVNDGVLSDKPGHWLVNSIGAHSLPPRANFERVARAYTVSDRESFFTARELMAKEGILGGGSTGALLAAALRYCREQTSPKKVLTFVCEAGNKYLPKIYNDHWMLDNGFLEHRRYGDLRDLVQHPYRQRDTIVVAPEDSLTLAYQRMKRYGISQLPVMQGGALVGIVDEGDVLLHVYGDETLFRDPVSVAMIRRLDQLDIKAPIEALLPVFSRGHVPIVTEDEQFVGLITRIDLLNHLRRSAQ